jgi:hypothetical protein
VSDLAPIGVIDLLVSDEQEATAVAKQDCRSAEAASHRHLVTN